MSFTESRPNWLSEIIEQLRIVRDGPIPLAERKVERDAIVAAIKQHPEGQSLAALQELPDIVWAALGAAYHWEQQSKQNPHLSMASPAIHGSHVIFSAKRWRSE
ncbi:MAG: hypothetical protein WD894_25060 [Pirellulales bacterium]